MHTSLPTRLWVHAWSMILGELSHQELEWLARPREHISLLTARRTAIILSRVRLIAMLFTVLTPLWILVDMLAFPRPVWLALAAARLAATLGFAGIIRLTRCSGTLKAAYRTLALLFALPTLFYLFSYNFLGQQQLAAFATALSAGYAFLPFVMLAGLSIFPLTLAENLSFATPVLAVQLAAGLLHLPILQWPTFVASFWLLLLLTAVAALSGLSQLAFMIVLVRDAIRDALTGCFSRNSGEELMELQFILSSRTGTPLSLVFVDLDHFKSVNDQFGHDAGDRVLAAAADCLRQRLRTGDILIRWGGEEFVLIMPNTRLSQARRALERVCAAGLGKRPDGSAVTASMGVAERQHDATTDWGRLVEMADQRMYLAKRAGRNCIVDGDTGASAQCPAAAMGSASSPASARVK